MRTIIFCLATFLVALALAIPARAECQQGITQTPGYVCTPCDLALNTWDCEPAPGGSTVLASDGIEGANTISSDAVGSSVDTSIGVEVCDFILQFSLL